MPVSWATGLSILLTLLVPGVARAQSVACNGVGAFPCGNQIGTAQIQPVPQLLQLQARVSEATLPIAAGVFNKLIVELKHGDELLCSEEFHDVRITNSTINLEIGRNMNCDLAETVATNEDLALQICIGGTDKCLRPIDLGTVPYALKSTYALLAQQAHEADLAGQAYYAHRAAADRNLELSKELGTGYFDFSTPDSAPELYPNPADFAPFAHGGFITWTPEHETAPTLHIAARDAVRDTPVPLDKLLLEANSTETLGRLVVKANGLQVTGASSIDGATTVIGMLSVNAPANGDPSGLDVQGPGRFTGTLDVGGPMTVDSGGLHVTGDSDIDGSLSVTGALTSGPLTVQTGGANITGDLTLTGDADIGGNLTASTASFTGLDVGATGMTVNGSLTLNGPASFSSAVPMTSVPGDFNVPGTLTAGAFQMSTPVTLPSVAATGTIGSAGKNPSSGMPSGWAGVHTQDVLAEGNVGAGPSGGPAKAYIDSSSIHAQSAVINGDLQVATINGVVPGPGGSRFYWTSGDCAAGDVPISYKPDCEGTLVGGASLSGNHFDVYCSSLDGSSSYWEATTTGCLSGLW